MMFASLTLLFATSCKGDDPIPPEPPVVEITLGVSGGTDVTVLATDISKDVTVTASEAATEDIIVSLSSNAAEGEATFAAPSITIKKGEKSAVGQITFAAAKFPKGTNAKKITVTISTTTENVKVDVPTTDFSVKGEDGADMPELTITANGTEFNTTNAAAPIKITFTLSQAYKEELPITVTIGAETADAIKALFPVIPVIKLAADETSISFDTEIPQGIAGKLVVNFAIDNQEVVLKTNSLSATFTVDKPVITPLCALTAGELNNAWAYMAGFKIGSTTVNLTRENPAYQNKLDETIVNITDGDEVKVFAAGNGDAIFTHVWVDWNKDNQVTENELVASSTKKATPADGAPADENFLVFNFAAPASTAAGTYHMRIGSNYREGKGGCDNTADTDESRTAYDLTINYTAGTVVPGEDPTFAVVNPTPGDIVVPTTGDKEVTFKVQLSKAAEEEQTITLAATSTGKNGTINPTSVVFAAGETSKDVKIKFLSDDFTSDAVTATVTVTGTSQNLTATAASIAYKVKGTAATTSKQDLQYYLVSESGTGLIFQAADESKVLKFYVRTDAEEQNGDVTLNATVTGTGVVAADYSIADAGVIVSPAESKFKRFEITVNKSAIGKTLVVSITSDDTTIDGGTLSFPITLATAPANPFDYKVDYTVGGGKAVEVTSGGWLQLTLTTTGEVEPETTLLLTPVLTGGITIGGITGGVLEMDSYSKSVWINVTNFNNLANGTTGKLTFTSPYTTFAADAGVTFTIKK